MLSLPLGMATSTKTRPLYRFVPYEVDAIRGELRKLGVRIRLERKPWLLLLKLLDRPGELVTRAELHRVLWGEDTFVDFEHGLNVAVKKLRVALCDSTDSPRFIETVSGQGYRFIAEVELVASASSVSSSAEAASTALQFEPAHLPANASPSQWRGRKAVLSLAAIIIVALVLVVLVKRSWRDAPPRVPHSEKAMLVVLPFQNLSGDPGQEYFSDGMTEELSAQLGNLDPGRLGVIGRTSAMAYKNSHATVSEVGKQLGVDYVLEGSVRRDGSKLRVTAQLIEVAKQAHVWAESYDRDMRDLLQLESDIASSIAREVGVSIALARPNPPAARRPNPEAHEAYLLGRYYWNRRAQGDWKVAEEHFRRAIRLDPQYALAHAGLAECRVPKGEASAAALRAVELEPASAEARVALGWVELYKNLDVPAGGRAFHSAVQLDPNYASAHHSYGEFLGMEGRFEEAIAEKRQAILLDPLSARFRGALAELLALAGQDGAALSEMQSLLGLHPDYPLIHRSLAEVHLRKGRYHEAIRELQIYAKHGDDPVLGLLGYAYAKSGKRMDAERILAELSKLQGDSSLDIVRVEIGLGHMDEALTWLEKRYQVHTDEDLLWIKVDSIYDPLRSDRRFQALLGQMNFPQ
jgi:TolB-like protein/DNA-binding winged helix-turn-helix (wHTH) protein/Tfp pilus assembly protein PilF